MSAAAGLIPDAIISGWSHGHFGSREASLEQLVSEVVDEAICSQGRSPSALGCAHDYASSAQRDTLTFAGSVQAWKGP